MKLLFYFIIFSSGICLSIFQETCPFSLAGKSFVLLVSTFPFPLMTRFQRLVKQLFKERSEMMTLFKKFRLVVLSLVLLFLVNGCYTTFKTVGYSATGSTAYAAEPEQYSEEYDQYENEYQEEYYSEEQPLVVEETLHFRPSRLIVKTTYFDYPGYVRRVRYVACDPYYYEEYVSAPTVSVNLYFGIGAGFRFIDWWDPWYVDVWFGFPPPVYWTPYPIAWYDPWWGPPVYVPYPVYYPVPIYYPVPDPYYPPYGGDYVTRPPRDYKRRDWDRRRETVVTDHRRIVRRGSATSAGIKRRDERRSSTTIRRPERNIRRENSTTRLINSKETVRRPASSRESTRLTRTERKRTDERTALHNARSRQTISPQIKRGTARERYPADRRSYTNRTTQQNSRAGAYTERTSKRSRHYSEPVITRKADSRKTRGSATYSPRSSNRTKVKSSREANYYRRSSTREFRGTTKVSLPKTSRTASGSSRAVQPSKSRGSKSYSTPSTPSYSAPSKSTHYRKSSSARVSKKSDSPGKSRRSSHNRSPRRR